MSVEEPAGMENGNDQEKLLVSEEKVEEQEKVVTVVGEGEANA